MIYILAFLTATAFSADNSQLTVFTSRKTHMVQPVFDLYQKKTGIKIEHVSGKAGALIERIKREKSKSPADVLLTVDAGNLWFAASQDLLKPVTSEVLKSKVPETYRDQKNRWFGFSLRARTIFYNKELLKPEDLKGYEDLADPKWKGKLCLRTSRKVYNQSLVASLIDRWGEEKAKSVVEGWVANLTRPVYSSDTLLLEAIDNGRCQVGIANTYYLARLQKKGKAQKVTAFWPKGVHVNVSGGGIVKTSTHAEQAQKFLEWLTSDEAQDLFAQLNDEYPIRSGVPVSKTIKSWGTFEADERPMEVYGKLQKRAVLLMDQAKYK